MSSFPPVPEKLRNSLQYQDGQIHTNTQPESSNCWQTIHIIVLYLSTSAGLYKKFMPLIYVVKTEKERIKLLTMHTYVATVGLYITELLAVISNKSSVITACALLTYNNRKPQNSLQDHLLPQN